MPLTRHVERHFTSGEAVRDIVIGMSDGLTVPFALAAGLSGAVKSTSIIITAGLAEIAAGSIAMGLGGYLAARSDAEHYASERRREHAEVRDIPAAEIKEVTDALGAYGVGARGRGSRGTRVETAARGVDRLHDAVRVGPREARPETGPRKRGHDRGGPTSPAA
jgi:VIT family protein